jgi:hypothetical protein
MGKENTIQEIFSKNRAEEFGYDVWKHFVVPRFYDRLDLTKARKPRIIIGGRGCGKTMLLRYLSHQTTFSRFCQSIPDHAISHIGLYWRADTQFCNAMVKRGKREDTWQSAFNHFAALILSMEVLNSLKSIAESSFQNFNENNINEINFSRLSSFGIPLPNSAYKLYDELESLLWEFEGWVNDVRKKPEPIFLPGVKFVISMIKLLCNQISGFDQARFYVYLDEYENLCMYQQKIINTWLKHSESPLIFNLAMKRNSFDTKQTVGPESLSDIHDYRQHDLEEYLIEENFQAFAAEILFLNLSFVDYVNIPVDINELRNPEFLSKRKKGSYTKQIIAAAQGILPDVTQTDLAKTVFENPSLSNKLRERIEQALKHRSADIEIDIEKFYSEEYPEATIIVPALLHRKRNTSQLIADEFEKLKNGKSNKFTGSTNWIHNNFVGCLLHLYAPFSRACPFYSGFRTYCSLSRGNLRHFLELCHKSIYRAVTQTPKPHLPVDTFIQAEAARQASASFLGEIKSFGRYGNQMHNFVMRLGSLFEIAHRRYTQSESEQSHFSIKSEDEVLESEDIKFLREATKWSVLIEQADTKKKDQYQPDAIDYVLNPIYSPYFHISYRKKRKLELSTSEVRTLIAGSLDQYQTLAKSFAKSLSIEKKAIQPSLFSLIDTK